MKDRARKSKYDPDWQNKEDPYEFLASPSSFPVCVRQGITLDIF